MSNTDISPISITVQAGAGSPQFMEFAQESIIIGSGPSANVHVEGDGVSSIHAMIKNKGAGGVTVLDLGSESGTEVNGTDVAGEHELLDGDVLRLGACRVTVNFGGHVQDDPTRPDFRTPPGVDQADATESTVKQVPPPETKIKQSPPRSMGVQASPVPAVVEIEETGDSLVATGSFDPSPDIEASVFARDLRPDERPTESSKVLEVVMLWGDVVSDVTHLHRPGDVNIGDARKNTFRVSHECLPSDQFALVRSQPDGFSVDICEGLNIEVKSAGKIHDLETLKAGGLLKQADTSYRALSYKLGLHDRVAVKVGAVTFVIQYVAPGKMPHAAVWQTFDYYFGKVFTGSLIVHIVLFLAMKITPWDPSALSEDLFKNPNRFAKLILNEPDDKDKKDLSGKKGGAKHKDKEGKFGKKEKPKKDAMSSKKGAPQVDANKREKDRKIALNAGALGILRDKKGGAVSNVFGPGGLGTGMNNALGGLRGADMGDAGGAGGLGTRGTGPGGGGSALGIGGLGSGTGRGTGGRGDIDLGGRGKGTTRIVPGKTVVQGSLSKEEIGRVIRRYLNQIKYCYEKELPKNPNLYGKVVTMFTIGATGSVTDASAVQTSLNDANVEECVLRILRRIRFPRPRGGGIVVVTYPFIFQQSGQQ